MSKIPYSVVKDAAGRVIITADGDVAHALAMSIEGDFPGDIYADYLSAMASEIEDAVNTS